MQRRVRRSLIEPAPPSAGERELALSQEALWWQHWPFDIIVASVTHVTELLLHGCRHGRMSWPKRYDDEYSYQVCPDCGIHRLFDPRAFRPFGPHRYDVGGLVARERIRRATRPNAHRPQRARLTLVERSH